MEQCVPPWTVHRQVWSDSLKAAHSGVSTDILLFSDLNLSLNHHYRVHRRGLPHIAFRKDYMSKLRALLPVPVVVPSVTVSPPVEFRDDSPGSAAVSAAEAAVPEVCPAPRGGFDIELAKVLLDASVMPMMLTPIVDPMVDSVVSLAAYPEPPLPVVLEDVPVPIAESSPWPSVADSPV